MGVDCSTFAGGVLIQQSDTGTQGSSCRRVQESSGGAKEPSQSSPGKDAVFFDGKTLMRDLKIDKIMKNV